MSDTSEDILFREVERLHKVNDKLRSALAEAMGALSKLTSEVKGSLSLMEPLCRREFGNTNYNILIQRADEADALLAKHRDSTHEA